MSARGNGLEREFGGTLISIALPAIAGVFSGIVLARTLGPVGRGEFASVLIWPLAVGILGELGLGFAFSYYVARDGSLLSGLWTLGWVVSLGWGSLLAVAAHMLLEPSLALSDPARAVLSLTLATVPIALATGLQSYLLLGIGALKAFNVVRAAPVAIYVAGVLGIALGGKASVAAYAIAWAVAQTLTLALATVWLVLLRRPRWEWRPALFRPVAVYGAKAYVSGLAAQMTLRLDQLLMTALGASAVLGVYVVAGSVASLTSPLFAAFAIVVMHRAQEGGPSQAGRRILEYLQLAFLLGVPSSLLLAAAAPWLVPAVFGASYQGAVLPAAVLLVASVFQGANAVLGNGLRALGLPGRPARAETLGLVVTLGLLALLLPRFGAVGAAVASLLAYALVTVIQTGFFLRAAGFSAREIWAVDFRQLGGALGAIPGEESRRTFSSHESANRKERREGVLVYRIGFIGDTVLALPALNAIRAWAGKTRVFLLCECDPRSRFSIARSLVEGSALVDGFVEYAHWNGPFARLRNVVEAVRLLLRLRSLRLDRLVYLAPAPRPRSSLIRDRIFFRLAGMRRPIGFKGDFRDPGFTKSGKVTRVVRESEALLARLAAEGVISKGREEPDLRLGAREEEEVSEWLAKQPRFEGAGWVAIGAGSKRPLLLWPEDRLLELGKWLWEEWHLWPVVLGGAEDEAQARRLVSGWRRGFVAAGQLSIRGSAEVLRRSLLFVGNDSGPMHLAAAMGRRCVAIFSARNAPGKWEPRGEGHIVLRKSVPCEGCELDVCTVYAKRCLVEITVAEAETACEEVLRGLGLAPGGAGEAGRSGGAG